MADIFTLMRALPISALEPKRLASIGGLVDRADAWDLYQGLWLIEPPAGERIPFINPVDALITLLPSQGVDTDEAKRRARAAAVELKDAVSERQLVNFFNDAGLDEPECLPFPTFLAWLRERALVPSDLIDFMEDVAADVTTKPLFYEPDEPDLKWSLQNAPAFPPPKAMFEFVPCAPATGSDLDEVRGSFLVWREAMRPIARSLEETLGEPVYYFCDLDDENDDDAVHRFLVLHWCCTYKPNSAYVRYLMRSSGARDIEELKDALIDPASYTLPFQMNHTLHEVEADCYRIDYASAAN